MSNENYEQNYIPKLSNYSLPIKYLDLSYSE